MSLKTFMTWRMLVVGYLVTARFGNAGPMSVEIEPHHHHHDHHQQDDLHDFHDHHVSVASSFMHFHGPVEGPEFEVKVPYVVPHHTSDEHNHLLHHGEGGDDHHEASEEHDAFHHGYTIDYVAHPKYKFSYGVEDHHTGDYHGQKETRDGSRVSGEYSVMEPGGTMRVVTYHADKGGFHAVVHTSGKNDHSGATYSADAHHHHQDHHHVHQELHIPEETQHHEHQELQDQGHHQEGIIAGHGLHEYATGYGTHEDYQ